MANTKKTHLGDEIFQRFQEISKRHADHVRNVCQRLARNETVSDGELLDALFNLTGVIDLASPLLPIATEIFQRYMVKAGIEETPQGIRRDWVNGDK